MDLRTLSADDVLYVHNTLVREFADAEDPIAPSGVRSMDLLQSAVGRQHTGIGRTLKYPDPVDNAATLLYGVCNDHPFYNGNKRTALVSMLVHLDKNKLTVFNTSQTELYALMIKVAAHTIVPAPAPRVRNPRRVRQDDEVQAVSKWLRPRVREIRRGERNITFRELRRILHDFGFELEHPSGNMIEIVKYEDELKGWPTKRKVRVRRRRGNIGWPGDNRDIAIGEIKRVREMCELREEDGIDSGCFYSRTTMVDAFVNRYRTLLRRLARV